MIPHSDRDHGLGWPSLVTQGPRVLKDPRDQLLPGFVAIHPGTGLGLSGGALGTGREEHGREKHFHSAVVPLTLDPA